MQFSNCTGYSLSCDSSKIIILLWWWCTRISQFHNNCMQVQCGQCKSICSHIYLYLLSEKPLFFVAAALHWNFCLWWNHCRPRFNYDCMYYILLIMTLSNQSCATTSVMLVTSTFWPIPAATTTIALYFCFTLVQIIRCKFQNNRIATFEELYQEMKNIYWLRDWSQWSVGGSDQMKIDRWYSVAKIPSSSSSRTFVILHLIVSLQRSIACATKYYGIKGCCIDHHRSIE